MLDSDPVPRADVRFPCCLPIEMMDGDCGVFSFYYTYYNILYLCSEIQKHPPGYSGEVNPALPVALLTEAMCVKRRRILFIYSVYVSRILVYRQHISVLR